MAEKKSTFLNMVAALFLVTFLSAFILGFVRDMTFDAIESSKMKAQHEAIKNILPEFTGLGEVIKAVPKEGGDSLAFFPAYNASHELVGIAVKTWSKNGFGGAIQIMAGFRADGTITGYQVLEHKETPGLGSKMSSWFNDPEKPGQNIIGKNPEKVRFAVKKDGGDIDAVTASTITSRAFLEAVRRAYETYKEGGNGISVERITSQTINSEGGSEK